MNRSFYPNLVLVASLVLDILGEVYASPPKPPLESDYYVVVIDAGHGGKDTGAIGPSGRHEKEVALAISKKLASKLKGMFIHPVLVRSTDQFIDLKERARIARKARADLFISIHADAHPSNTAQGASAFILSENGASSEAAKLLAERENASETGGTSLHHANKVLASVLVDLSKNANQEASSLAAEHVLKAIREHFPLHNSEVQKANFLVLKSLDVPSLLVELAFISNPEEESRLSDPNQQLRIAEDLANGIKRYVREDAKKNFPPKKLH